LALWSGAAVVMAIVTVGITVAPDPTDPDPVGSIIAAAMVTGLVVIIWLQALVHQQAGLRMAAGWRRLTLATWQRGDASVLGMELLRRITAIDVALPATLDRLTESTTTATEDDLAKAHEVRNRAVPALRELRAQSLAVARATTVVLSSDKERLAGARHTVDQRLTHALIDCETLVTIAGAPDAADFREKFGPAVARVHGMVGEVMPTNHQRPPSMLIRVLRAFRSRRS
jgi:hypothetical protein